MSSLLLILALTSPEALEAAPAPSSEPASQAMLEIRVVEAEPLGARPGRALLGLYDPRQLDTWDLDRALVALEGRGDGSETPVPSGGVPVPGMGVFRTGAVVTSPRIIVQEGESAEVESGPVRELAEGEPAPVRIEAHFRWEPQESHRAAPRVARLQLTFHRHEESWEQEMLLARDETGVLTVPRSDGVLVWAVTFRPLD